MKFTVFYSSQELPTGDSDFAGPSTDGYGSKLGTPKLWMVNTKLD